MSSVLLFIIVLFTSFIVVRIGAIAFQLTGLEWSLAKFQALSCFTGTGFTTRESELITGNPQRRRIASVLMVSGNAGFVILIATFASSLVPRESVISKLSKSFLPFAFPDFLVIWINLAIIVVAVFVIYKIFTHQELAGKMTNFLRKKIIRKEIFRPVSFEELLLATGGYGISRVKVRKGNPVSDKTLLESSLRSYDIMVLAIVRDDRTTPNPPADMKILPGDELVCFGKLGNIRDRMCINTN